MVRISRRSTTTLLCGLFALTGPGAMAAPPERTLTVDPVELVAGRETPGKAELSLEHEGIEYWFATAESKAAFAAAPAKFEVADGGACGSMGPLSGMGDARRFTVHEGRIFFFASDGCRASFLKNPAKCIETPDPIPTGTPEQAAQGRAAMDQFLAWAGGAEPWRGLASLRTTASRRQTISDKDWAITNEVAMLFPDRIFQKDTWNEMWYTTVRSPEGAVMASHNKHDRLASSRRDAFDRWIARHPAVILKAYADGPGAGLAVVGDGEGTVDETPVWFVKVALRGATSRLAIERSTGRPVQLTFHGRDGTSSVGDSARLYTSYATVDGITLPTAYTVTMNGKSVPSAGVKIDTFEPGPALPADLFQISK